MHSLSQSLSCGLICPLFFSAADYIKPILNRQAKSLVTDYLADDWDNVVDKQLMPEIDDAFDAALDGIGMCLHKMFSFFFSVCII